MFYVNLAGRENLSGQIYRQVRQAILERRLLPKDCLPPSRELARTLSVSRATVTTAYERLAAEGFVDTRQGAGTYVNEVQPLRPATSRSAGVLAPRRVWESIPLPTAFDTPAQFDFRTGLPDARLFPHRAWRRLVAWAMRSQESSAGVYRHPAGDPAFRSAIARHVGIARGVATSPDNVVVTGGTQQALGLLARVLLAPGGTVAVEDPGYRPPAWLFRSLGLEVVGVPVDEEGLVVDAIPRGVRAVYVTPSHQYPLSVAMTLRRKQALLGWADKANAAVIEDDYDSEFRFGGRPLEPLQAFDRNGRVVYVGSFSKTMLPTLRLGFLVAPPSLRTAIQKAKFLSDWHAPSVVQGALARFIDDGEFARHVRKVSKVYRERHRILERAIREKLGDHLEPIRSSTGLHLAAIAKTASVPQMIEVARRARDRSVAVQLLSSFAVTAPPRAGIVLGYGAIDTARIGEGISQLGECFLKSGVKP